MPAVVLAQLAMAATASAAIELWPLEQRDYQHRYLFGGQVATTAGPLWAEFWLQVIWWGRHETKHPGSPVQAEGGKVLERRVVS